MDFESFKVTGLFGRFNHELKFRSDERIIIMIGPNGFGKTMTLRMIDNLFNRPLARLVRMPFQKMEVAFDDGSVIVAEKALSGREPPEEDTEGLVLTLLNCRNGRGDLGEVVTHYKDEFPHDFEETAPKVPSWLEDIRESIAVKFIGIERLTRSRQRENAIPEQLKMRLFAGHSESPHWVIPRQSENPTERTVRHCSAELAKRVQKTMTEYGTLSQSLDRTFPSRLLREPTDYNYYVDHFVDDLREIEKKRSDLIENGLIDEEEEPMALPETFNLDGTTRRFLAIYAQDAKQKLGVFDDLYKRIRAFRRIANSRFLYKRITVGSDGLSVVDSNGSKLALEMLSSGEQHELVILYELLFQADRSLILVDEPELSLHIQWQAEFLNDIEEMATVSNFRVILATHSPDIIGDRWDLTAELKGPDEN